MTLLPLQSADLELVRYWRNHPNIRDKMHYREYITEAQQQQWFAGMRFPERDLNFMIMADDRKIGLLTSHYDAQYSEAGMFIWEEAYLHTPLPVLVSVAMSDINFYLLHRPDACVRMLKTNKEVISYNRSFGYELCEGQEELENQLYRLTREQYEMKAGKLREKLAALYRRPAPEKARILFEEADELSGVQGYFLTLIGQDNIFYEHFDCEIRGKLFHV